MWLQAAIAAAKLALQGSARAVAGTPLRALGTGLGVGAFGIPGVDLFPDDEAKKPRRRRRRALTASDRADIAFISGTLGQAAGKAFAVQLAARSLS